MCIDAVWFDDGCHMVTVNSTCMPFSSLVFNWLWTDRIQIKTRQTIYMYLPVRPNESVCTICTASFKFKSELLVIYFSNTIIFIVIFLGYGTLLREEACVHFVRARLLSRKRTRVWKIPCVCNNGFEGISSNDVKIAKLQTTKWVLNERIISADEQGR